MGNIKEKTINSSIWSFLGNNIAQILRFTIGVVLARILTPKEYGLIGMIAIFISIGDALVESGFSQALIQKKNASEKDFSTVFYFNIIVAIFIYIVLWASASLIAGFFREKILENIIIILSLGLIIRSFTIVQNTQYIKNLNFKIIAICRILATIFSGFIAVPMALNGYGVWSLVGLAITQDITYSIFLWFKSKWKPKLIFSIKALKEMFGFGSRILGIGLLDNIFLNIYKLIIGKFFSAAELGYYSRAQNYRNLVSKNLLNVINSIIFPSFAAIQNNIIKVRDNYKKASELATFLAVPLLFLLAFIAEPLIRILITEKWLHTVPYLQVLCAAGIFYPISGVQVNVLKALGRANEYFIIILVHKIIIIISILIAFRWGVIGLVYAQVVTMFVVFFMGGIFINKFLFYKIIYQFINFFKYILVTVIIFYFTNKLSNHFVSWDLGVILLQTILGLAFYIIITKKLNFLGNKEAVLIFTKYVLPKFKKVI